MSVNYIEVDADGAPGRGALANLAGAADARGVVGITDDGRLVGLVHVRPGMPAAGPGAWWAGLTTAGAEPSSAGRATEVSAFVAALPAACGFAQVIRGQVSDRPGFERILAADAEWISRERPEIVGGALAWHGTDRFTLVVCFTDEESARAGEAKNAESPGAHIDELMRDVTYAELRDPWTAPL